MYAVSPRKLFSYSIMNPRTTSLPCIGWRAIVRATFWATSEGCGSTGRRWREDGLTRVHYDDMTKGRSEYLTGRGATMENLGKPKRTKDVTILVAKVNERTRKLNHAAIRREELQGAERIAPRTVSRRKSAVLRSLAYDLLKCGIYLFMERKAR